MIASAMRSAPLLALGRWLVGRSPSHVSLVDQGLVSGLGFLTSVAGARLLGLQGFGRFAVVMILAGLAQAALNAVIVAPMMSLAGTSRGRSPPFFAAALAATAACTVPLAVTVMALFASLEMAEGKTLWLSLIASAGALTIGQTLLYAARRMLFALERGQEALLMDAGRAAGLLLAFAVLYGLQRPVQADTLVWVLAALAGAPALVAARSLWRARRGRPRPWALLGRCWPMAKWMLPSVMTTFAQEQAVWLVVGYALGDASVGGLRAAQYLVSLAYPFLAAMENTVPVDASRAFGEGGRDRLRAYLGRILMIYSPLALGFPAIAAASPAFWLHLFYGDAFVGYTACLRIFALVVLIVFVRDQLGYFFRATQQTRFIFQAFVFSSVTTLVAMVPLIRGLGVTGAAASIALGQGLSLLYLLVAALRAR